jgi:hypothetical protein
MRNVTILVCLAAGACASAGTKVDPETVASFVRGRTTVAEAEAALGEPNGMEQKADGSTALSYVYTRTSVRAVTFVPIVGAFAGGADAKTQKVVLRFGTDGTYQGADSASGSAGAGYGLSAD